MKRLPTAKSLHAFRRTALAALLALGAVPGCTADMYDSEPFAETETIGEAADELGVAVQPHAMDAELFDQYLQSQLLPLVKGYAATAGRNGQIVAESAGGIARNPAGGGIFQAVPMMTVDTPSNVGSVSKYFSGTALLHFMQLRDEKTLDQWLDTPFLELLPKRWVKQAHASLDAITVRQLLQHKSGIRGSSEDPFTLLSAGVSPQNVDARSYNNLNYKLLTYIIPVVADASLQQTADSMAAIMGKDFSRVWLGVRYHDVMMNQYIPALPAAIDPSCRPTTDYGSGFTYALAYGSKADPSTGQVWDSWQQETGCRAQGGWYFSARDLTGLGMSVHNTTYVIDHEARDAMWDWTDPDERIVFAGFEQGTWMANAFGGENRAPHHNGSHGWNNVRAESVIMLMPDNTVLSVVINSPVGTPLLENMLENAYRVSLGL